MPTAILPALIQRVWIDLICKFLEVLAQHRRRSSFCFFVTYLIIAIHTTMLQIRGIERPTWLQEILSLFGSITISQPVQYSVSPSFTNWGINYISEAVECNVKWVCDAYLLCENTIEIKYKTFPDAPCWLMLSSRSNYFLISSHTEHIPLYLTFFSQYQVCDIYPSCFIHEQFDFLNLPCHIPLGESTTFIYSQLIDCFQFMTFMRKLLLWTLVYISFSGWT